MSNFAVLLGVAFCLLANQAQAAGLPSTNVRWLSAGQSSEVQAAFGQAKAQGKPVLMYWGATWCPPCNQLKATLFNRQDFAVLARSVVAVHVDGDKPGAQKLGEQYKFSGYPTTVLFSADGQEITRLPGEVDAPQALEILRLGIAGGRPVQLVMDQALAGKAIAASEWRMLAYYSWDTDEQRLVPKAELPARLAKLAQASAAREATGSASAEPDVTTRLWLKALAASDDGKGLAPDDALRQRLNKVLADPTQVRTHMDVLTNSAPEIVRTLEDELSPRRTPLVAAYEQALKALQADVSLSRADRIQALTARIDLARLSATAEDPQPKIPQSLRDEAKAAAARMDAEVTDGYERQAVITSVAYTLSRAGLWAESEALLKANLARSHSPYYLMSQLGSQARKQGKKEEALQWYAKAYEGSKGPATRLQWGAGYLAALVDLAPEDVAQIERTASQIFKEAAADASSFEGRSARSLKRSSDKLLAWGKGGAHAQSLARLKTQAQAACKKLPANSAPAAQCGKLLQPA